jgi:mono/diheme cytochrome c family protein
VTRAILVPLLAVLMTVPATAAQKAASPQRAFPGAGWSRVPVTGSGGEQVFHRYCWECHGDGPDRPGTLALQAKYKGEVPARLDQRTDLNVQFVVSTVRHGISVMPSMRKTEISDAELHAIAAYLTRKRR